MSVLNPIYESMIKSYMKKEKIKKILISLDENENFTFEASNEDGKFFTNTQIQTIKKQLQKNGINQ
jgi:hypothetical protein